MARDLHQSMCRFRMAARELFNHYFAVPPPPATPYYDYNEGFIEVEQILFTKLVLEPCAVPLASNSYVYGIDAHPGIRVRLPIANADEDVVGVSEQPSAPIMLNREINSGYWDYSLDRFTNDATLLFVSFFDWSSEYSRDNAYVLVQVSDWASHPEAIGKQGLVESHYVRYVLQDLPVR